ncbi:aminotransferase class V-fold PLP-dependent enzyme [Terrisporobacter mayombei]|uniref:aminotransferase class V-fold PLP-dependent enzyme n=1 Tax=Terrisporobacter mayombei TaxID=1541 RepID=UPI001D160EB1|nr:aminotransferase class V-fold PLP-dependent enzyme [Terrisporobacter mayombei]
MDKTYNIQTRSGLHCAPFTHKTMGTFPNGTVRFSFGHFNTVEYIDYVLESLKNIISTKSEM